MPALLADAVALLGENGTSFDHLAGEAHLTAADDLAQRLRLRMAPR